jgi:hypothetical protein
MNKYLEFNNAQEARTHRHEHGTGGWIFVDDETKRAIIFPCYMTPINIFNHWITQGRSGSLIGAA